MLAGLVGLASLTCGPVPAGAAAVIKVQFPASVYDKPDFESPIAFTLEEGATVIVSDKAYGAFKKIKTTVLGKTRIGYVPATDLKAQKSKPKAEWGLGGGLAYSRLSQGAREFSTVDSVSYKISGYTGQTVSPLITFQSGNQNFWRLYGMYRRVQLSGTATTNIAGLPSQNVELEYTMLGAGAQMAWGLFAEYWYGGFGVEAAKAVSDKVMFGNQDLSGDSENPDYLSGHGFSGVQVHFMNHFSFFSELRLGVVSNQQPVITVMEIVANLMYWP